MWLNVGTTSQVLSNVGTTFSQRVVWSLSRGKPCPGTAGIMPAVPGQGLPRADDFGQPPNSC